MISTTELLSADTLATINGIATEAVELFRNGGRLKLLATNSKMRKVPGMRGRGWIIKGLAMAPADIGSREACQWRSAGCTAACNGLFSGGNTMPSTRRAMIQRKEWYFQDRKGFLKQLFKELQQFQTSADRQGLRPACRLNVSTDIVWERIAPEIFTRFPGIEFYDYSKAAVRHRPELPKNYTLSHSVSERSTYGDISAAIEAGRNIVAAFNSAYVWGHINAKGYLPARLKIVDRTGRGPSFSIACKNGDRHDLRIAAADGRGNCIALRGKGGRAVVSAAVESGFILDFPEGQKLRAADRLNGTAILVC